MVYTALARYQTFVEKTWVPRFLHRDAGDVSGENEVKTTPGNPFPPVPPIWGYSTGETS